MIKVGFLLNFSKEYKGGINYIKNLLYTNSITRFPDIEFYLIVPSDIEQEYVDMFSPYAKIIYTDIFKSSTLPWFLNKLFNRLFKYQLPLLRLIKKHDINVISHSFFWGNYRSIKIVNWIPDFQCLHFPELWTIKQLDNIININNKMVAHSDIVVLSSHDALQDYKKFAPTQINKARVLQFVSQPGQVNDIDKVFEDVKDKYKINGRFFYLPNQFWTHKDHMTAFKAFDLLVKEGLDPILVTTGVMNDFRKNNDNLVKINEFIKTNGLEKNILLLGVVPYEHVLVLMRKCLAVINPSLFEGWSSTVEEAKSIGKKLIISDLPVHREQNAEDVHYFKPTDEIELASILRKVWSADGSVYLRNEDELNAKLKADLTKRTIAFSTNYYNMIKELVGEIK